jgi:hypothetical protein
MHVHVGNQQKIVRHAVQHWTLRFIACSFPGSTYTTCVAEALLAPSQPAWGTFCWHALGKCGWRGLTKPHISLGSQVFKVASNNRVLQVVCPNKHQRSRLSIIFLNSWDLVLGAAVRQPLCHCEPAPAAGMAPRPLAANDALGGCTFAQPTR